MDPDEYRLPAAFKTGLAFAAQRLLPRLAAAAPGREALLAREYNAVQAIAVLVAGPSDALPLEVVLPLARAAFEAALDLELLAADADGERTRQARAFDAVQRHQAAEKLAQFAQRFPGRAAVPAEAPGEEERIAQTVREVWGFTRKGAPRIPEHWSALRPSQRLEALRAARPDLALAFEGLYRESWFRAAAARAGGEPERRLALRWHRLMAFEMMLRSAATAATAIGLGALDPESGAWLRAAVEHPGVLILRDEFDRLAPP